MNPLMYSSPEGAEWRFIEEKSKKFWRHLMDTNQSIQRFIFTKNLSKKDVTLYQGQRYEDIVIGKIEYVYDHLDHHHIKDRTALEILDKIVNARRRNAIPKHNNFRRMSSLNSVQVSDNLEVLNFNSENASTSQNKEENLSKDIDHLEGPDLVERCYSKHLGER